MVSLASLIGMALQPSSSQMTDSERMATRQIHHNRCQNQNFLHYFTSEFGCKITNKLSKLCCCTAQNVLLHNNFNRTTFYMFSFPAFFQERHPLYKAASEPTYKSTTSFHGCGRFVGEPFRVEFFRCNGTNTWISIKPQILNKPLIIHGEENRQYSLYIHSHG